MDDRFVKGAVTLARNMANTISASSIIIHADKTMSVFDLYLKEFQIVNGYDTVTECEPGKRTTYIIAGKFFDAIANFNTQLIEEYIRSENPTWAQKILVFTRLIDTGSPWDFKNRTDATNGNQYWNDNFFFGHRGEVSTDYFGNWHYGYVGAALFKDDYSSGERETSVKELLLMGGAVAQTRQDGNILFGDIKDNPGDSEQIMSGIEDYFRLWN
jgi:hypothetical protein